MTRPRLLSRLKNNFRTGAEPAVTPFNNLCFFYLMPLIDPAFEAWLPKNGVKSVKTYMNSLGVIEAMILDGKAMRDAVPQRTEELRTRIQNHPDLGDTRKSDLSSALNKYDDYQRQRRGLTPRSN